MSQSTNIDFTFGRYDPKKNKEMYLKVLKYFANDESLASYMHDEKIKKRFIVFYDRETDSYLIEPNSLPAETNPNTKL